MAGAVFTVAVYGGACRLAGRHARQLRQRQMPDSRAIHQSTQTSKLADWIRYTGMHILYSALSIHCTRVVQEYTWTGIAIAHQGQQANARTIPRLAGPRIPASLAPPMQRTRVRHVYVHVYYMIPLSNSVPVHVYSVACY